MFCKQRIKQSTLQKKLLPLQQLAAQSHSRHQQHNHHHHHQHHEHQQCTQSLWQKSSPKCLPCFSILGGLMAMTLVLLGGHIIYIQATPLNMNTITRINSINLEQQHHRYRHHHHHQQQQQQHQNHQLQHHHHHRHHGQHHHQLHSHQHHQSSEAQHAAIEQQQSYFDQSQHSPQPIQHHYLNDRTTSPLCDHESLAELIKTSPVILKALGAHIFTFSEYDDLIKWQNEQNTKWLRMQAQKANSTSFSSQYYTIKSQPSHAALNANTAKLASVDTSSAASSSSSSSSFVVDDDGILITLTPENIYKGASLLKLTPHPATSTSIVPTGKTNGNSGPSGNNVSDRNAGNDNAGNAASNSQEDSYYEQGQLNATIQPLICFDGNLLKMLPSELIIFGKLIPHESDLISSAAAASSLSSSSSYDYVSSAGAATPIQKLKDVLKISINGLHPWSAQLENYIWKHLGWDEWSDFTGCSVTCGKGVQQRFRRCRLDNPMVNLNMPFHMTDDEDEEADDDIEAAIVQEEKEEELGDSNNNIVYNFMNDDNSDDRAEAMMNSMAAESKDASDNDVREKTAFNVMQDNSVPDDVDQSDIVASSNNKKSSALTSALTTADVNQQSHHHHHRQHQHRKQLQQQQEQSPYSYESATKDDIVASNNMLHFVTTTSPIWPMQIQSRKTAVLSTIAEQLEQEPEEQDTAKIMRIFKGHLNSRTARATHSIEITEMDNENSSPFGGAGGGGMMAASSNHLEPNSMETYMENYMAKYMENVKRKHEKHRKRKKHKSTKSLETLLCEGYNVEQRNCNMFECNDDINDLLKFYRKYPNSELDANSPFSAASTSSSPSYLTESSSDFYSSSSASADFPTPSMDVNQMFSAVTTPSNKGFVQSWFNSLNYTIMVTLKVKNDSNLTATIFSIRNTSVNLYLEACQEDGLRLYLEKDKTSEMLPIKFNLYDNHWHQVAISVKNGDFLSIFIDCSWSNSFVVTNHLFALPSGSDVEIGKSFTGELQQLLIVPGNQQHLQCSSKRVSINEVKRYIINTFIDEDGN